MIAIAGGFSLAPTTLTSVTFFLLFDSTPIGRRYFDRLSEAEPALTNFRRLSLVVFSARAVPLNRTAARDQVEYQDDHGDDQQEMNEVATEATDESQ
jgi:hypothetical protein